MSFGLPLKFTSLIPPHLSPPLPTSHFRTSDQARSFTALCMGTIVFMSEAWGLWFFRAMAEKNWASEGYSHLASDVRGIDETSRSVDNEGWFDRDGPFVEKRVDQTDRVLGPIGQLSPECCPSATGHLSVMSSEKMNDYVINIQVLRYVCRQPEWIHSRCTKSSPGRCSLDSLGLRVSVQNAIFRSRLLHSLD